MVGCPKFVRTCQVDNCNCTVNVLDKYVAKLSSALTNFLHIGKEQTQLLSGSLINQVK